MKYSKCYISLMSSSLADVAHRSDEMIAQARGELVRAVREAAAAGLTQGQIALEIGRSQPEVSRLLRFHGTSPLARRLRANAGAVRRIIVDAGGRHVRVFGSVATGRDGEGSDVDLLFTPRRPLSLMKLGAVERQIGELLGVDVDLVPDSAIRPDLRDRILSEAVPL
jgi:uncharacterized protein